MRQLGLSLECPLHPGRAARIDSTTMVRLNHEVFYFAEPGSCRMFLKHPDRYCGPLTDPVTLNRFHPTPKSPRTRYRDRLWYFDADSTLAMFQAMPDSFLVRKRAM